MGVLLVREHCQLEHDEVFEREEGIQTSQSVTSLAQLKVMSPPSPHEVGVGEHTDRLRVGCVCAAGGSVGAEEMFAWVPAILAHGVV